MKSMSELFSSLYTSEANPPPGSAAEDVAGAMGSTDNPTVMTNME